MRVLLCDDHPVYRDGLRLLMDELGFETVAEAATGEEAVERALALRPDVVVMDLGLPGISGVEATRMIVRSAPGIRVLVVTMIEDDTTLLAALRAGAGGYLLKGAEHDEVRRALEAVARGDVVISRDASEQFRSGLRNADRPPLFPGLTARESEILDLVARGRTNGQIADSLFLSPKTVRNAVSIILTKIGAMTRAEAVSMARDAQSAG